MDYTADFVTFNNNGDTSKSLCFAKFAKLCSQQLYRLKMYTKSKELLSKHNTNKRKILQNKGSGLKLIIKYHITRII